MRILFIILITLFLIPVSLINAQEIADSTSKPKRNSKGYAIRIFYQAGKVIPTNNFVKGVNYNNTPIESYRAMSAQFGWQTYGKKLWQQIYGYPYVGVGFYMVNFKRPNDLGEPAGVYGFLNGPVVRWKKASINYNTGIGMLLGWIPYDDITNPYQIAIGAKRSVILDMGLSFSYFLSKHFEVDAGISFTHYSNGSMTMPNYGLNDYGPRLGLKYNIQGQPDFIKNEIPKYESQYELLIEFRMAFKQITPDTSNINYVSPYSGENYGIYGISSTINKQISYKTKLGIGFDLIYDGSTNAQIEEETNGEQTSTANFAQSMAFGIFPSYELVIHSLSLLVQPGFYLYKKKIGDKPSIFYQRIGLKYHIIENIYAGVNIHAYNFKVADYVEWNIGYRIIWKKQRKLRIKPLKSKL